MKRKMILLAALFASIVLVSLIESDSTVRAEPPQRYTWDTGIISRNSNQILRVTVTGALDLNDLYVFRVNHQSYTQDTCNSGICKLTVASQTTTAPISLAAGEAATLDFVGTEASGTRVIILSNRQNLRVNAQIINASGEVATHIIMANTEGDFH